MSKRRIIILGGIAAVILLILGGIMLGFTLLTGQVQGTIVRSSQVPAVKHTDPYAQPGSYSGKFISFTVPADYEKLQTKLSGSYLEVVGYYSTDHANKHIAAAVVRESLSNDSGLSYRQQHANLYHQDPDKHYGIIFYKNDASGTERTAYVSHGDLVATFAITTPFQSDLHEDMQIILNSLAWQ